MVVMVVMVLLNMVVMTMVKVQCYRSQGSAEESCEEERTDEEASHSPAQILSQETSQQTGWYGGQGHQTGWNITEMTNLPSSCDLWDEASPNQDISSVDIPNPVSSDFNYEVKDTGFR